jgi:hypothetical protein
MSRRTSPWIVGLIISLAAAVLIGGTSFVLMTIGSHRFLSATDGKSLSDAELARILDESLLIPMQVTAAGMFFGGVAALSVPVLLVGVLLQARSHHDPPP